MGVPTREEMLAAATARHGRENQQKLSRATVAVCGLGGLGSNTAIALARAGVGKLILIDFDRVDVSNLHRQQYKAGQVGMFKTEALAENLAEIAPYIAVEKVCERITEDNVLRLVEGADIVCEALDNAESKAMLVENVLAAYPSKYIVACSGMAGFGSVNAIKTRRVSPKFYLCGDGQSDVGDGVGLVASRVMLCAAHQAHTVVRIITGQTEV